MNTEIKWSFHNPYNMEFSYLIIDPKKGLNKFA
jgi:hypothetical protein